MSVLLLGALFFSAYLPVEGLQTPLASGRLPWRGMNMFAF